ncbi:MAG TPA: zf-HC2 domain-containing protein [Streptosporangiaceae bacterium]|nr:zf-HC2 domain-containing protein [Streptosporangiaceae bacterium]
MTPTWDCAEARLSLGVYVLGVIDPAERSLVDAHLQTCRECRDELAGLAGLPALLARVNPDEISRICPDDTVLSSTGRASVPAPAEEPPPGELIGTVLDLAAVRRRRTRWRFAAAAAAVVAVAGGLFGGLNSMASPRTVAVPLTSGSARWETVQAASSVTGASASVAYSHEQWGDAFEVLVDHIPVGTTCQLYVVHPDGTRTQVAAWTVDSDEGKVWYGGSMPSTAKAIDKFEITAGKRVLLTAIPT